MAAGRYSMKERLTTALLIVCVAGTLSAGPVAAKSNEVNLTPQFVAACVEVEQLQAIDVGGVVIIRGKTHDRVHAENAGRVAQQLGYKRVANLIRVIEPPDDALLARKAERELAVHRSLAGCEFRVASEGGILVVGGRVRHELQKDLALGLLKNIDGVRGVRVDFTRF